jgi:hypothetical protein
MNDLDTHVLRRALRAPQEPGSPSADRTGPADVAAIISRGRRLRWRRRALAAGGGVCLAAAIVGAVAGIGRLTTPSPGPAQHVVSPVGPTRAELPSPSPTPSPTRSRGRAVPSPISSATAGPTTPPTPMTPPPTPITATATQPQALPTPTPTPMRSAHVAVSARRS